MKKIIYIVLGLGVIYLILCAFGPAEIKVERSVNIKNTTVDNVQHRIADFKFFHDVWSPWSEIDTAMKITYGGECCKPGSSYAWDSENENAGKGTMVFNEFKGDSVLMTLTFEGMGATKVYYLTIPEGDGIKVTWGTIFKFGFFGRAPMLFMDMDKMLGTDYEKGLNLMKTSIESAPVAKSAYDIKEIDWQERFYIGKRATLKFAELPKFFGENYQKIGAYIGKNKVEMQGAPAAIYFKYDEEKGETDFAAVFGIKTKMETKEFEVFQIPSSKVLLIEYYGAYDKSANAHYAMDAYMKEKGLTQSYVIEEYVTDPMMEKDTAKWLTNIYYVLNK